MDVALTPGASTPFPTFKWLNRFWVFPIFSTMMVKSPRAGTRASISSEGFFDAALQSGIPLDGGEKPQRQTLPETQKNLMRNV